MTQDQRWLEKYNEVWEFIDANRRNPSKHRIEEHDMLNWLKANRKQMNANSMKQVRIEPFKQLLALVKANKHLNQYI